MPIFLPASTVNPPDAVTATSPDGFLTATINGAGVHLKADFSSVTPFTPYAQVRFVRLPDINVRSGNNRWAPAGVGHAYDFEAPLGVASTWVAYPINALGIEQAPSQAVTLTLPNLSGIQHAWIKSCLDPALSMPVRLKLPLPTITRSARTQLTAVQGAALPVGAWDVRTLQALTFQIRTESLTDRDQFDALLDSGPLLVQLRPEYGLADFFSLASDSAEIYVVNDAGSLERTITVPFTPVPRPDPYGAPLIIPNRTYAQIAANINTYSALTTAYPTYSDMVSPA